MQSKNQAVETAWAKVESQYQRRFDLIPNLVETVKAAANFEKGTLTQIAEARASVGRATVDIKNATPEQLAAFQSAHTGLSAALSKLMVVTENYPQLKANDNFVALTAELAGTENRVAVARNDFNMVVQEYNTMLVRFPGSLLASYFGFHAKPYFKSVEKAAEAPKVQFN
jgi:LemA protein